MFVSIVLCVILFVICVYLLRVVTRTRTLTLMCGGSIAARHSYIQRWVESLHKHMYGMKEICGSTELPDTFLDMWILEQVGHCKYSWSEDDALHRCLKRYGKEEFAERVSTYAKKNMRFMNDINTRELGDAPHIHRSKYIDRKLRKSLKDTKESEKYINRLLYVYKAYIKYTTKNMQLATPPKAYKEFSEKYGVTLEGFASPLNHYFDKFCSPFPGVDKPFGSIGSFFDVEINESTVCNPPFEEEVMYECYKKIERTLSKHKNIYIILIVPRWDDAKCILDANKSKFLFNRTLIEKSKTNYISYEIDSEPKTICAVDTYVYIFKS